MLSKMDIFYVYTMAFVTEIIITVFLNTKNICIWLLKYDERIM